MMHIPAIHHILAIHHMIQAIIAYQHSAPTKGLLGHVDLHNHDCD